MIFDYQAEIVEVFWKKNWWGMHFEALSTKYVNFNHFGWFFENFVTKFLFFWQFFLSFLVWEIILLSKNLSILGIFHLSYTQREIKKIIFQTSSTCKFASWTWQGKLKQSKFSANRLEYAHNTTPDYSIHPTPPNPLLIFTPKPP